MARPFMFLLWREKTHPKPIRTKIPTKLTRL